METNHTITTKTPEHSMTTHTALLAALNTLFIASTEELAEHTGTHPAAMRSALGQLEGRGHIVRSASREWRITAAGRQDLAARV